MSSIPTLLSFQFPTPRVLYTKTNKCLKSFSAKGVSRNRCFVTVSCSTSSHFLGKVGLQTSKGNSSLLSFGLDPKIVDQDEINTNDDVSQVLSALLPFVVAVTALSQPSTFTWVSKELYAPALGGIMLSIGIKLSLDDFALAFKRPNTILQSVPSTETPIVVEEEKEIESDDSETNFRGCKACRRAEIENGCNGEGRIQGGIATVPGFGWWPIKAYRPCPAFVLSGGRYRRTGQSMDEVVSGGSSRNTSSSGTSDGAQSRLEIRLFLMTKRASSKKIGVCYIQNVRNFVNIVKADVVGVANQRVQNLVLEDMALKVVELVVFPEQLSSLHKIPLVDESSNLISWIA